MKAPFGAEAIGYGNEQAFRAEFGWTGIKQPSLQPWVAEISGRDPRYGYERRFLSHKTDYSESNSKGTRGVWFWWTLETGRVYEARFRTSWGSGPIARYLRVTDTGDLADMSQEEVEAWLANVDSESTS